MGWDFRSSRSNSRLSGRHRRCRQRSMKSTRRNKRSKQQLIRPGQSIMMPFPTRAARKRCRSSRRNRPRNSIDSMETPRALFIFPGAIRFLQSRGIALLGVLFILTAFKWGALLFTVHQYETVIITRFGKAIRTETKPGLKLKLPVLDVVHRFDNRILAWDGPPTECPTKDKLYLIVDCFARWRISNPLLYYNRLNDERSALSRLDDILGSETRTAVATHDLVEIIRVTKGRQPVRDEELEKSGTVLPSNIPDIQLGRGEIEKQITERTRQKIADFGIELLDERFKRSKYNPAVAEKIIERMSSERHQIAAKFRSEGKGEAANISGQKESDVAAISSG